MVTCGTPSIRRRLAIVASLAIVVAFPVGAQAAVDPGVNYDPASPAGKEYAIPLALGRAEGAGTEDQQAAANTPFGIGITPPGAGAGAGSGGADGGSTGGAGGTGGAAGSGREAGGDPATLRSRIDEAEEAGGTAARWTLGIALAVTLAAALLTVGLRERREHQLG